MALSESILVRLAHQHETISELVAGFPESQLKQRLNPDKWSIFENIVHLAAYQPIFIQRVALILGGNRPKFERYIAENDPQFNIYLKKSNAELLRDISIHRVSINNTFKDFKKDELMLVGHHPKLGSLTMSQWAEFFLLHEAHHLFTILQLIGAFRIEQQ